MIIRALAVATVAVIVASSEASATCSMSYCKDKAPTRSYITNTHRQKVGDLYKPGSGQRIQIRDTSRRIVGYIELDGSITNPNRQKKGSVESLSLGVD